MRLTFVPPAFVLSSFITSHVAPVQSKILLPSMLSGMFFGTNTPESPVLTSGSTTVEAAIGSDAPSTGEELSSKSTSGSADLVPKQDVLQEVAKATHQSDLPATEVVATQSDARGAEAEAATEKIVAEASQDGGVPSSQAVEAAAPVNLEDKQITEEDALKNSELLQSVSKSAETSWISEISKETAAEALLPLVALAPVLAAAGFHADIETSSSGAPLVRFPSIDYAVHVEDLPNYN